MSDNFSPELPLQLRNATIVGESRKTTVVGLENTNQVAKFRKENSYSPHNTTEEALDRINDERLKREELRREVAAIGITDNILPESHSFIFGDAGKRVHIGYGQQYFEGRPKLSKLGWRIFTLNESLLENLKKLFQLQLKYAKEHTILDLIGSATNTKSPLRKIFRHLMPLMHADNIILDDAGNLRIIDSNPLTEYPNRGLRDKLFYQLDIAGAKLSISILSGIQHIRNGKQAINILRTRHPKPLEAKLQQSDNYADL